METKFNVLGHPVDRLRAGVDDEAGSNATTSLSSGIADGNRPA